MSERDNTGGQEIRGANTTLKWLLIGTVSIGGLCGLIGYAQNWNIAIQNGIETAYNGGTNENPSQKVVMLQQLEQIVNAQNYQEWENLELYDRTLGTPGVVWQKADFDLPELHLQENNGKGPDTVNPLLGWEAGFMIDPATGKEIPAIAMVNPADSKLKIENGQVIVSGAALRIFEVNGANPNNSPIPDGVDKMATNVFPSRTFVIVFDAADFGITQTRQQSPELSLNLLPGVQQRRRNITIATAAVPSSITIRESGILAFRETNRGEQPVKLGGFNVAHSIRGGRRA